MHILILSKRDAQAQARLLRAAEALAEYFNLDPDLVTALKPQEKDIKVRGLKQREAAAALVEALAIRVGALEEPTPVEETDVTAVTDEDTGGEIPEDTTADEEPVDELPPPVLEEPVEEEPEEKPAPKPSKKKTTGKSSKKK